MAKALLCPAQVAGGPLEFEGAWGLVLDVPCLCCGVPLILAVCRKASEAKCKGRLNTILKGGHTCAGKGMLGAAQEGKGCSERTSWHSEQNGCWSCLWEGNSTPKT